MTRVNYHCAECQTHPDVRSDFTDAAAADALRAAGWQISFCPQRNICPKCLSC